MSLFSRLLDFAGNCWASEYATSSPSATFQCSGLSDAEAARAGGKPRNDPLSNGAYGDIPFVPAGLKISRFHRQEF